jgi:integrase
VELRVDEIDLAAIEAFEAKLKTSSLSPRTRLKYSIVLRMLLDHAVRRNVIAANPMASRGRRRNSRLRKPSIKVYDIELVEAIAAQAGGDVGEMIKLAAYSGLRQSELLALRWRDIKWAASVMQVNERYGSTERDTDVPKSNQVRSVPMSEQSNDLLEQDSTARISGPPPTILSSANATAIHAGASPTPGATAMPRRCARPTRRLETR